MVEKLTARIAAMTEEQVRKAQWEAALAEYAAADAAVTYLTGWGVRTRHGVVAKAQQRKSNAARTIRELAPQMVGVL
jgi:hypothetical protein